MDLSLYVEDIRRQLGAAAEAGDDQARAVAERLGAALDAAIRLAIQDALTAAAEEITLELAPGSVEVRLRGRDPEFVVTPPPGEPSAHEPPEGSTVWPPAWLAPGAPADGEEDAISRINLRLPEHLKARIERAAGNDGLSVNSWLVRAAAAALNRSDPARRRERRTPHGAERYSGWAR